jgi:hypothetical protein
MRRAVISGSFVLAVVALLLLAAAQRRSARIVVERNLVYGMGGAQELKLDLAMPKKKARGRFRRSFFCMARAGGRAAAGR